MQNTIEEIEQEFWGAPLKDASYLITTCHNLRRKNIDAFTIEDFRILIGQNIGLEILISKAIQILNKDILAEGDFYEGDLLKSVLTSRKDFWKVHPDLKNEMTRIYEENIGSLDELDTTDQVREGIKEAYEEFKKEIT